MTTSINNEKQRQFVLALVNHTIWSALPVASRYLQVYAEPMVFDGQGVLATSKATSALVIFTCGQVLCPDSAKPKDENIIREDGDEDNEDEDEDDNNPRNNVPLPSKWTKIFFALLFGIVCTFRAALNIASSKFTLSYYIAAINSLSPLVISFGDKVLLKAVLPAAIWPCIFSSILGCSVIAISQSPLMRSNGGDDGIEFSFTSSDTIGCSLQFMSMCFSAAARLLMKRTENILSRDEAVQTNNICNCIFPLIYTLVVNPSSWEAFGTMNWESFLAWATIAVLVYTIASQGQMSLVRSMGPGVYSSFGATRVLLSALLSAVWLNERVKNWLEWIGLLIIMFTMTIYTLSSVGILSDLGVCCCSGGQSITNASRRASGGDRESSVFAIQLVPLKDELDMDDSGEKRELL